MKHRLWLLAITMLALASGCAGIGNGSAGGVGPTPAAFAGALPCADCEAIDHTLELLPDGSYRLELLYRGKGGSPFVQMGRWEESADGASLALLGREPRRFAIANRDALRLLDRDGAPIVSSLNYTLARVPDAALAGTRWTLLQLDAQVVAEAAASRTAHIVLDGTGRVAGSDGCNRLGGGYRLDGEQLSFAQLVSTRMACAGGMEQADRFGRMLGEVARYRIAGNHLELLDAAGAVLARFAGTAP